MKLYSIDNSFVSRTKVNFHIDFVGSIKFLNITSHPFPSHTTVPVAVAPNQNNHPLDEINSQLRCSCRDDSQDGVEFITPQDPLCATNTEIDHVLYYPRLALIPESL